MRLTSAVLVLVAGGCRASALAQSGDDPLAPVRCYMLADAKNLASESAIQLCSAALSEAPGRCYVEAVDRLHQLSEQKVLTLCAHATSLQPLNCYRRLAAAGTITEDQMISYCATRCALGPAPAQVSDAGCIETAIRIGLALQTAGELCAGSRSAGPALCLQAGRDLHTLTDSSLVRLCSEARRCQSEYPPPTESP